MRRSAAQPTRRDKAARAGVLIRSSAAADSALPARAARRGDVLRRVRSGLDAVATRAGALEVLLVAAVHAAHRAAEGLRVGLVDPLGEVGAKARRQLVEPPVAQVLERVAERVRVVLPAGLVAQR